MLGAQRKVRSKASSQTSWSTEEDGTRDNHRACAGISSLEGGEAAGEPGCESQLCHLSGGSDSKESSCNVGDPGSTPGSGRSPREGNGNPLQYSCL